LQKLNIRSSGSFIEIPERTTVKLYARSVGTLPNKGNNNGTVLQGAFKRESPQKQTKPIRSSTIWVLGLENLHAPIVFILGSVLWLDEWHLAICYQNPPFSWENACTKSGMCWFAVVLLIHCTSCFVVVFFSLILQNRTIGFEIKSLLHCHLQEL
jgi:hypothetical protein